MARRNRDKVLYDNDGTVLIQSDTPTATASSPMKAPSKAPAKNTTEIKVTDVLDTLAGFTIPRFNLYSESEGKGECILCGKETTYKKRKVCVTCLEEHGEELYAKARNAIENGETTITL